MPGTARSSQSLECFADDTFQLLESILPQSCPAQPGLDLPVDMYIYCFADDTFWFLEGVLKLANDLDSTMPYIITDERYWHNWNRPHVPRFVEDGAPRCLPCNFNPEGRP